MTRLGRAEFAARAGVQTIMLDWEEVAEWAQLRGYEVRVDPEWRGTTFETTFAEVVAEDPDALAVEWMLAGEPGHEEGLG